MPNKQTVLCFTDVKGSTQMGEQGNQPFADQMTEHSRVIQCLAERIGGRHIKAMSDGHFLSFDFIEHAMNFVAQVQQYYKLQPALSRPNLAIKMGLSAGIITPIDDDALGSGANKASRIQNLAAPGEILVDEDFVKVVGRSTGANGTRYFISMGQKTLRDITPPEQEVFAFDWQRYVSSHPTEGLAGVIYRHLEDSNVEVSNLSAAHLANAGIIIWPVVPRDFPTAIHRGQTEIVRLLALLGWQINILVADCGAKNVERSYSARFLDKLRQHLAKRGVAVADSFFLSQFFEPSHPDYSRMQSLFRDIATTLTLQDLLDINHKEYRPEVIRTEIAESATLDCLRPALSLAAVSHLVQERKELSIVISGKDEYVLWNRAYGIPVTKDKIGVLMNPKLTEDGKYTARQSQSWPSWYSKDDLERAMEHPNLAWWVFCLHAYLPIFPATVVNLAEITLKPSHWKNQLEIPKDVDKRALAEFVWPLLNPSA